MVLLCFLCLVMGQNPVVKSKSPHDEHWARLVVMSLAISAVATLYLLLVLGFSVRLVDGGGPWFVTGHALEDGELFDATRNAVAFATFTIAGGAAYLAYRRQRATDRTNALTSTRHERDEKAELQTRFTAAVEQLAHSSAPVRIAGVHSLAAVADRWLADGEIAQAQVAVDVLCGYLRLPYSADLGANHQSKRVVKTSGAGADEATEDHFEFLQNDRVVRQTICSVLADRLRGAPLGRRIKAAGMRMLQESPASPGPWSGLKFDFSGAHLISAKFEACQFDEPVTFNGGVFEGHTDFSRARFDTAHFNNCDFQSLTSFTRAVCDLDLTFVTTRFRSSASFTEGEFDRLVLHETTFGAPADFRGATFVRKLHVERSYAVMWDFARARFLRGGSFKSCGAGVLVTFKDATITGPLAFKDTSVPSTLGGEPVEWDDEHGVGFSDVTYVPAPSMAPESSEDPGPSEEPVPAT